MGHDGMTDDTIDEAADAPLVAFEPAHDVAPPGVVVLNAHVGS